MVLAWGGECLSAGCSTARYQVSDVVDRPLSMFPAPGLMHRQDVRPVAHGTALSTWTCGSKI